MSTIPMIIDHFNNGVIGKELIGRVRSSWYLSSLQECKNGIITPYGTIKKRVGTKYIANINCNKVKFIPFIYSDEQAYALLMCFDYGGTANDNRIYFFALDSYVVDSTGAPYYVTIPTAWDDTIDVDRIYHVQKKDVLYLFYKGNPPLKLTRIAENNWTIETVTFTLKYIVGYGNGTSVEAEGILPANLLEPSNVQLSVTVGGATTTVTDDGAGNFTGTNITKATIDYATGRFYLKTSAAIDTDTPIMIEFLNQTSFYPACGTFFDNRLIVGNLPNDPQVIMGSVVGSYEDFIFGTKDNNAWVYEIASQKSDEVAWITGVGQLFIGTLNAEYVATGGATGITPTSISIVKQSEFGSAFTQPVLVGNITVFLQFFRTRLYEFVYSYEVQGYIGNDLNVINPEILNVGVKEIAVEYEPYKRIWALLNDGSIAQLTFLPSQSVMAWQKYETNGAIKTITSIPSIIDNYTQIYMVVERNGRLFIESTQNPIWDSYYDTIFVDSAVIYSDSSNPVDILSNLPFSDGDVVKVFTRQGVHPDVTVENGTINLNWTTDYIVVGYGYEHLVSTIPIEIAQDGINTIGKPKSLKNINLYLYNSMGGEIGMDNQFYLLFRTAQDLMDNPVPLFTGYKEVDMFDKMFSTQRVWISLKHELPIPFELGSISFDLVVGENL